MRPTHFDVVSYLRCQEYVSLGGIGGIGKEIDHGIHENDDRLALTDDMTRCKRMVVHGKRARVDEDFVRQVVVKNIQDGEATSAGQSLRGKAPMAAAPSGRRWEKQFLVDQTTASMLEFEHPKVLHIATDGKRLG